MNTDWVMAKVYFEVNSTRIFSAVRKIRPFCTESPLIFAPFALTVSLNVMFS